MPRKSSVVPVTRFLSRRFGSVWAALPLLSRRLLSERLDRLTAYLEQIKKGDTKMHDLKIVAPAGEPIIVMTRSFKAPRELIWKALSEPEHVIRWWGPHTHRNKVLEFDWRVGGKWRIQSTLPNGNSITFFGEYIEIGKPNTVTQTFSFDGVPDGGYSVDTVVLEQVGDRTLYIGVSRLPNVEARDGMIASGMEVGVVEGFERLDRMLEEFKTEA